MLFVSLPKKGHMAVRILPWGERLYHAVTYHWLDGKKYTCRKNACCDCQQACLCCAICNKQAALQNKQRPGMTRLISSLSKNKQGETQRYFYVVIVRGREAEGPKVLACNRVLHRKILEGVSDYPIVLPWYTRLFRWIGSLLGITKPLTICNTDHCGVDFCICVEKNGILPDFRRSGFSMISSRLGTPAQVQKWLQSIHSPDELMIYDSPATLEQAASCLRLEYNS